MTASPEISVVIPCLNEALTVGPCVAQALETLTQPTIDRTALEGARVAHLQLADQASKRFTQLIADVGDVLTPAQRTQLAAHLRKLHGMDGT